MKIIVTGGSGLIGSALKECKDEHTWLFMSSSMCDLRDYHQVYDFFKKETPDYIIHLAAKVGGLYKNMNDPVEMVEDNLLMNINVLRASHALNVQDVMCCLSTCIFPDKVTYPIDEHMLHQGPPHPSNYGYAYAKRMLEVQCRAYQDKYQRNYFCIIPTNVYGPHDNFNLQDAHVIPALIHKCYLSKQGNTPFYIKGSGSSLRQFIYSKDIAKCILHLINIKHQKTSLIMSVSETEEVSISDVVTMIATAFDVKNIIYQPEYNDGQYKKTVNNDRLRKILPKDFTFTPMEEAMRETVQWFTDNYQVCRK